MKVNINAQQNNIIALFQDKNTKIYVILFEDIINYKRFIT